MPLSDYSYSELPNTYNTYNTSKVSRIWRHACAFLLSVTVILIILLSIPQRNEFPPLDNFQDLWVSAFPSLFPLFDTHPDTL